MKSLRISLRGQGDELAAVAAGQLGGGQDGQERAGQQGEDGPAVLGGPAPDLVLVQPGEFLPAAQPSSILHRDPATRTNWASGTGA